MRKIAHHVTDRLIAAYLSGQLPHAYSLVVASHIELCDQCRATWMACQTVAGVVMELEAETRLSPGFKKRVFEMLDSPASQEEDPCHSIESRDFPSPIALAIGGSEPRWRSLGGGLRQQILCRSREGTARLLYIPAGMSVPEHGHRGLELTMVIQGAFSDETGEYGAGDVEIADGGFEHQPVVTGNDPCICIAATDNPLSFKGILPSLLQPIFRI